MAPPFGDFYPPSHCRPYVTSFKPTVMNEAQHEICQVFTPCNFQHGLWLMLVHVLLKDCCQKCPSFTCMRVMFNLSYQKLGNHKFTLGKSELIELLKKAEMRSWMYMCQKFEKALLRNRLVEHGERCKFCLYCNQEKCISHHFDLKIISLLHLADTWFKITPHTQLSIPLHSHNNQCDYLVSFIIDKSPVVPTMAMVKGEKNYWSGPFQVRVTKHFKQLFWDCPKSNSKIQSLFHSAVGCCLRNNLVIPDLCFPGEIQELNGLWRKTKQKG